LRKEPAAPAAKPTRWDVKGGGFVPVIPSGALPFTPLAGSQAASVDTPVVATHYGKGENSVAPESGRVGWKLEEPSGAVDLSGAAAARPGGDRGDGAVRAKLGVTAAADGGRGGNLASSNLGIVGSGGVRDNFLVATDLTGNTRRREGEVPVNPTAKPGLAGGAKDAAAADVRVANPGDAGRGEGSTLHISGGGSAREAERGEGGLKVEDAVRGEKPTPEESGRGHAEGAEKGERPQRADSGGDRSKVESGRKGPGRSEKTRGEMRDGSSRQDPGRRVSPERRRRRSPGSGVSKQPPSDCRTTRQRGRSRERSTSRERRRSVERQASRTWL
jgi:hypothetical protein